MGTDIHLHIIHKNQVIAKEIYKGRNSEWFDNMSSTHITEPAYRALPLEWDWDCDGECPEDLKKEYLGPYEGRNRWTYGERSIKVKDFEDWYTTCRPHLKGGYVTKYDAWLYRNKNIAPDPDTVDHYLPEEEQARLDMEWIEFIDIYEPSTWLYHYLMNIENKIPNDAWLVYCFDN